MFTIEKDLSGIFWHIYNNSRTRVNVSDFDVVIDSVSQTFIVQCKNGSNIPSQAISISLMQVIDLSVGTSPIAFSGADGLIQLLMAKNYTPYLQDAPTETVVVYRVGQVGLFTMTNQQFIDNFTETGLGRNTMLGWALRNGSNGTKNQQGKFSLNKGATPYDVIGAIGGSANAVLIGHKHTFSGSAAGTTGGGSISTGNQDEGGGSFFMTNTGLSENGVSVPDQSGEGKNMPPYLIDVWVERVTELVINSGSGGGGGGIPTLQQVLDNNQDLVDGNFFAGTTAGGGNLGININAFGELSALNNEGSDVNSLGNNATNGNLGNDVNAFGFGAGVDNTFNNINLFGENAQADENGQTVLSKDGTIMARISTTELTESRKYTLQDANGTIAFLSDITGGGGGTVTSVGLTMPSAFTVTNSPITSSGDIAVTGAGAVSQYVRGDGSLANFPTSSGGGSSLSFYLNGSVSQGTIGGVAFREMDRTPILGAGTDFTINANGYIQSFITDAGVPNQLEIPAGNWNFETYFSASSGGGSPSFYLELYKWDGTTLSLIASSSANPEFITGGTNTDLYVSALAVPQTTLLATDRLAVRIYVTHSGRTITLHTENSNLCQVITTFSTGLTALNGLTAQVQNLATGTTGTDFGIVSSGSTHTFNLPNASAANRGALSSSDWTTFNNKQNDLATFQRKEGINFFEDFLGTNDNAGIQTTTGLTMAATGAGSVVRITGVYPNRTNQQGVLLLSTGTTTSGAANFKLGSFNTPTFFIGSGAISYEVYINIETLSTLANRFNNVFGLYTGANIANTLNGIFFLYDEGGIYAVNAVPASPNWRCLTINANTRTVTDSNIAITANAWTKLRIEINANSTSVGFYINDTLVATHTTNIPATTTAMHFLNAILKNTGSTSLNMYADYFSLKQTFTTAR